ncbi:SubName: Full=Uncharacterized protein {ECO:0000313/EMBL:CCA67733.1} [Serendipita indica DSM 11827]|uniref:Uncharacterized protein n=1 Tax=Serendipita indica (strain DSM 11827) TaxID=1109443 RepID=G4T8U0_SERID|nr:SubName: Full=Uncharacterized protein {ECO:0000313/EMBL:CCA67733.1} [Serendipita indica DSM 11827]CCA67733.1 hypothetical protein PIIN_01560 [Serendipita indica DSM 11827]
MSARANQRLVYKPLADNGHYGGQLTPRTPHTSRTGRPVQSFADAEEAFEDEEDIMVGGGTSSGARASFAKSYREQDETQSYPLLRSATSHTFPPTPAPGHPVSRESRAHAMKRKWTWNPLEWDFKHIAETAPLVLGGIGACILLILILLSVNKPDVLRKYILKTNGTEPIIPISKGTSSGGTTGEEHGEMTRVMEYENSCWKMMNSGEMKHGGPYWGEHHQHSNAGQANEQVVQEDDNDYDPFLDDSDDSTETDSAVPAGTCSSTITYVLDGNVGLFYDLALLAQAAALARERNRTFIVDDSEWNRGSWTDHFRDVRSTQPGPEPGCLPPSQDLLKACPRSSKHWVVTQRTAKFHFGHDFSERYENPYKSDVSRLRPIFEHAAVSFRETIQLSDNLREHLRKLRNVVHTNKPYVGVHIRHGDKYPANQQWKGDYVPISEYIKLTTEVWETVRGMQSTQIEPFPRIYVATDSLAAFSDHLSLSPTFSLATEERILGLHAASSLSYGERDWRFMASPHGYVQRVFSGGKTRPEERVRWTQGMLLDFAMLSGAWLEDGARAPEAVVCTATSNVCRMAAVALGWEKAFEKQLWKDVDWKGIVYPPWDAFEFH